VLDTQIEQTPAEREHTAAPAAPKARKKVTAGSSQILRFAKSERFLHWSIALPFLVSMASALILVVIYNQDPSRPHRNFFSVLHRVSGVALILLPMLATFKSRGDARIHIYNIKQAWTWMFDDIKWLALMGVAAVNPKIKLPEQGKFNAAEKINFMVLMVTYPLYVLTGLLMWLTPLAILSWIMHFFMAVNAVPLIGGHLYMALINPSSRKGLNGMITGHVDRSWGKHHYRRWYRDHHEADEALEEQPAEETGEVLSSVV
jgi:formate dehydrogenase subunit gamma